MIPDRPVKKPAAKGKRVYLDHPYTTERNTFSTALFVFANGEKKLYRINILSYNHPGMTQQVLEIRVMVSTDLTKGR